MASKIVELVLKAKDLFTPQSDSAAASVSSLKQEISTLDKELKQVESNQANLKLFEELSTQSEKLDKSLTEAKSSLDAFAKEQAEANKNVVTATSDFKKLDIQVKSLEKTYRSQQNALDKNNAALAAAKDEYGSSAAEVAKLAEKQKQLQTAVASTEAALSESGEALAEQKRLQTEAKQSLEDANRNYKAASKAVNKFETDLRSTNSQLAKVTTRLEKAEVSTSDLAAASKKLADRQAQLVKSLTQATTALTKIKSQLLGVRATMSNAADGVRGLTGNLVALAGTYIGIQGIKNALSSFIDTGAKFETFRKQFEGIMGSVAQGEVAFQWVTDFAKETPLDLEQTTQAFITLKGAGLDPMDGTLRSLTDATAKYTGGTAKLENITRQLSQAYSKAKITAEDMNTVVENGLPVWRLLEQATGKSVRELRNLSENGKLGRYELGLLFDELGRDSLGASAELMSTFNGQIQVLRANVQQFLDLIAQSGSLDYLRQQLTDLNAEAKRMVEDGSLQAFAQDLSNRFVSVAKSIKSSLSTLFDDLSSFASTVKLTFSSISTAANIVTISVRSVVLALSSLLSISTKVASSLLSLWGLLPNTISRSAEEISKFAEAMGTVAASQIKQDIADLNSALETFTSGSDKASNSAKTLGDNFESASEKIDPLSTVAQLSGAAAQRLGQHWLQMGSDLVSTFPSIDNAKANIDAVIQALEADPTPGSQRIISQLKAVNESLTTTSNVSEKTGKSLADLEATFENAGGTSLAKLKTNLADATEVFKAFTAATGEDAKSKGELREAYLNLLEAQLKVSQANNELLLPANLQLQASQLGLNQEYNEAVATLDEYNSKISGISEIANYIAERNERLAKSQKAVNDSVNAASDGQQKYNETLERTASTGGANVAFQKLWNEALERSKQVYDLASKSTEDLTQRTIELSTSLRDAFRNQSWSNILKPINDLNNAAKRNELQAIEQEKAYRKLQQRLESGALSLDQLNYYTRQANNLFDQLDGTRLDALHNQIDIAKAATAELKNELVDTLSDLQNELDELEGNQQAVLKRNYEAERAELEEKLKQAQASQDRAAVADAKEALRIQREIYDLKSKDISAEQVTTNKTVNENNNTNTNISEVRQVQEIRYTVTFVAGSGSATFSTNEGQVERLINQLEEAGITVAGG